MLAIYMILCVCRTAEQAAKLEERLYMQETLIDTLRKDNERLAGAIRELEMQNMQIAHESELEIQDLKKKAAELNRVKKQLREKEKQIVKMTLDGNIAKGKGGGKGDEEIRAILAEKDALIDKLDNKLKAYESSNVLFLSIITLILMVAIN